MTFDIKPYEYIGDIKLGMERSEVRKKLGVDYESFKRDSTDIYPCDHFSSLKVFIYYKDPGIVEAMEFYPPANLIFEGLKLFDLSYIELKEWLLRKDPELEIEEDFSLTSYLLGIGVYAPNADEYPNLPAESIIVFEKNYYEL